MGKFRQIEMYERINETGKMKNMVTEVKYVTDRLISEFSTIEKD